MHRMQFYESLPCPTRDFCSSLFVFFLFLAFLSTAPAQGKQDNSPLEEAEIRHGKWLARVTELTKNSVSNSAALSEPENSFHLALLAKILWKHGETEARFHLKRSAELFLSGLKTDDEKKLEKSLEYAQKTFQIIFELDEKFGAEVVGKLEASFEDAAHPSFRKNSKLASLYASIGIQVSKVNPKLGLAYGISSLRHGFAMELPTLVVDLNLKDRALAETLIQRAKTLATGSYTGPSYLLAFNLNRYLGESNKGKPFSTAARRSVAELFVDLLSGAAFVESERPRRCGIAYYAPWVTPRVDEYFPEQSARFRQNIQICVPFLHSSTRGITAARTDAASQSVDDLLKAARETHDNDLKLRHYREALFKLFESKKYEDMISILDGFDGDDYQKFAPVGWGDWRVRAASAAALSAFETGDIPSSFRYINSTPKSLRPLVRKRITATSKVIDHRDFYTENLNEMQKELDSLEIPYHQAASLYLDLAGLYLRTTPTESQIMFRNAAKFINKADNDNPDFLPEKDWAPMEDYVSLDAQLLEDDELNVFSSLNEISSRRSRLRLSFGLLESSIKRLKEAKLQLETLKRTAKKLS